MSGRRSSRSEPRSCQSPPFLRARGQDESIADRECVRRSTRSGTRRTGTRSEGIDKGVGRPRHRPRSIPGPARTDAREGSRVPHSWDRLVSREGVRSNFNSLRTYQTAANFGMGAANGSLLCEGGERQCRPASAGKGAGRSQGHRPLRSGDDRVRSHDGGAQPESTLAGPDQSPGEGRTDRRRQTWPFIETVSGGRARRRPRRSSGVSRNFLTRTIIRLGGLRGKKRID